MKRVLCVLNAAVVLAVGCHLVVGADEFSVGTGAGGESTSTGTGATGGTAGNGGAAAGGFGAAGGGTGGQAVVPCHPEGLVDPFEGSAIDGALWLTQGQADLLSVHSGRLHYAPQPYADWDQWAGMHSQGSFDLTGCSVWIEVPSLVNAGGPGWAYFELWHQSGQAQVGTGGGQIRFFVNVDGTVNEIYEPYDAAQDRWWRIREQAGTLYLETAPDGSSWTVRHTNTTPWFINEVFLGLGANVGLQSPDPGETQFDNVDALP